MTSINISIKKEAYDFLTNLKAGEKSYSDVILSLKKEQNNIMQFFGVLKDIDWNDRDRKIKDFRKSINKRLQ